MKWPLWCQTVNRWANRHELVLGLLLLVIILRLPSLCEPYWYGDEAIYLTLGVAMKKGAILYQGIVDHKTPIIYYLAMVPSQMWYRVLLTLWMMVTTTAFYCVTRRLTAGWIALVSSTLFVIFTTLPWMEGNIPNGELFVMGFVLVSLWLMSHTPLLNLNKKFAATWSRRDMALLFAAGISAGLAILTKVPAILDIGALGSLFIFAGLLVWKKKGFLPASRWAIQGGVVFVIGSIIPIILSVLYFAARGAFSDYLQFGLLYNLHYTDNWTLPIQNPIILKLFSLPGKAAILIVGFLITVAVTWWKKSSYTISWALFWVIAALFGSLLSNRPYPHYLLQIVPPACLFLALSLSPKAQWLHRVLGVVVAGLVAGAIFFIGFGFYNAQEYYQNFLRFTLGQISPAEYRAQFNYLVPQNEALLPHIQNAVGPDDRMFIWGTNPMLYAQAERRPASKYTVAFHIHDLKVYEEVMNEIIETEPRAIVVMKNESSFPELEAYIFENYIPLTETPDMILYRRSTLSFVDLLQ